MQGEHEENKTERFHQKHRAHIESENELQKMKDSQNSSDIVHELGRKPSTVPSQIFQQHEKNLRARAESKVRGCSVAMLGVM